eukprot:gene5371-biopygen20717
MYAACAACVTGCGRPPRTATSHPSSAASRGRCCTHGGACHARRREFVAWLSSGRWVAVAAAAAAAAAAVAGEMV